MPKINICIWPSSLWSPFVFCACLINNPQNDPVPKSSTIQISPANLHARVSTTLNWIETICSIAGTMTIYVIKALFLFLYISCWDIPNPEYHYSWLVVLRLWPAVAIFSCFYIYEDLYSSVNSLAMFCVYSSWMSYCPHFLPRLGSYVSELERRHAVPSQAQRHILAGLASVVGGLSAPYEKASHVHERPVVNWLLAAGCHPFGPFSNTSQISQMLRDVALVNISSSFFPFCFMFWSGVGCGIW